jgi:two-component system chemotaxis response regulator CheB
MKNRSDSMSPPDDAKRRVRVMLVEDSATELYLLRKLFELAPDLEIVGEARNGLEALELLPAARPDIVCTDYHMPKMDGLEFILRAKAITDCPIMVLSVAVQAHHKDNIFKLLAAGAVAVVAKPAGTTSGITPDEGRHLFETIREIARARPLQPPAARETRGQSATHPIARVSQAGTSVPDLKGVALVAIGASTGGPQILSTIFSKLPASCRVPIVCVQHISCGFLEGMVSWLQPQCKLVIEIAENGKTPQPGHIYFAPDGRNLTIDAHRRFSLDAGPSPSLHCPGIDPLFISVAQHYGPSALGILLSGMGRDGAAGLKTLRDKGAATIAQDKATSVIFGMPGAAIALGAAQCVLSTDQIARMFARSRSAD